MTLIRSPSRRRTSHVDASSSTVSRSPWTSAMTLIRTAERLSTTPDDYADPMRRVLWLTFVMLVACAPGRPDARSVEGQVWSPYCPGRLLTDCPTQQADELREAISSRIARGESEEEVLRWVRQEFGEGAIARPDTSG